MREPLDHEVLRRVGWFAPPFAMSGWLHMVSTHIKRVGDKFSQDDLEQIISWLFDARTMATMVLNRYPHMRVISDYKEIIAEGVQAHFIGLDHIAVTGLIPVIEGTGRKLAAMHGVEDKFVKQTFYNLAEHCKAYVVEKRVGAVQELLDMLDSFHYFVENFLYTNSDNYSLSDGTNRHGISHGKFSDADFGSRLNFYKIMSAINFMTLFSTIYYGGSGFVPDHTDASDELAVYYTTLEKQAAARAVGKGPPKEKAKPNIWAG